VDFVCCYTKLAILHLYHGKNKFYLIRWPWCRLCMLLHQVSNSPSISWQEQVLFDKMTMMSTLYLTNTFSWIFAPNSLKQQSIGRHVTSSLKQQSIGRHVTSLVHINLITRQPVFALLNTVYFVEKQHIPML
jgi:hypothetical protein